MGPYVSQRWFNNTVLSLLNVGTLGKYDGPIEALTNADMNKGAVDNLLTVLVAPTSIIAPHVNEILSNATHSFAIDFLISYGPNDKNLKWDIAESTGFVEYVIKCLFPSSKCNQHWSYSQTLYCMRYYKHNGRKKFFWERIVPFCNFYKSSKNPPNPNRARLCAMDTLYFMIGTIEGVFPSYDGRLPSNHSLVLKSYLNIIHNLKV